MKTLREEMPGARPPRGERERLSRFAASTMWSALRTTSFLPLAALWIVAVWWVATNALLHLQYISPIDEWVYLDYLDKLPNQWYVPQGQAVGAWPNWLYSCFGVPGFGTAGVQCGGDYLDSEAYPYHGITSAASYPPVFFWCMWLAGQVFAALPGVDELAGFRMAGLVWLLPGVTFGFFAILKLSGSRLVAFSLMLALTVSPMSWWSFTWVSTDAPMITIGAAALLVGVLVARGEASAWWFVPIGTLAGAVKIVALGPLFVGLAIGLIGRAVGLPGSIFARISAPRWWRDVLIPAVVSIAVLGGVQLGWMRFIAATAVGPPPDQGIVLSGEAVEDAAIAASTTFIDNAFGMRYGMGLYEPDFAPFVLEWLAVAGVVGAFISVPRLRSLTEGGEADREAEARTRARIGLSIAVPIVAVTMGPLLLWALSVIESPFALPARYGVGLVPGFLACTGALVGDSRLGRWLLAIIVAWMTLIQFQYAPDALPIIENARS